MPIKFVKGLLKKEVISDDYINQHKKKISLLIISVQNEILLFQYGIFIFSVEFITF